MKVFITQHVRQRLEQDRQQGVTIADVIKAAQGLPGRIPAATRFRGFMSGDGRFFDIVAKDLESGRLVITVIGKS